MPPPKGAAPPLAGSAGPVVTPLEIDQVQYYTETPQKDRKLRVVIHILLTPTRLQWGIVHLPAASYTSKPMTYVPVLLLIVQFDKN